MSDTIENPKGGYVLKIYNFDKLKKKINSVITDIYSVSIEIPDFDLNEFFAKRGVKERWIEKSINYSFNLNKCLIALENVEKPLLNLYYLYKKNPKTYNKLIENEQKIDKSFFLNPNDKSFLPTFFKLKKIWEKYIPFPKIDNINFCHFFKKLEGTGEKPLLRPLPSSRYFFINGLEENLINREIILSFLKPFFVDYPIKEIPIEKTAVDKTTQTTMVEKDNTDLKSPFLNKMEEEQVWEKLFPKTNINRGEKKRIYDDFHKNYPKDDFYKYIKGFKDINPNYDWKKYISVFLPYILHKPDSFPNSLLLTKDNYPIPGTIYNLKPAPILHEFEIYVAPDQHFFVKFRNIFMKAGLKFTTKKHCDTWKSAPKMDYWPQQLNFAVWCATSGCGISLNEKYPKQTQQFINSHVYFTIRRILYEMKVMLPDNKNFDPNNNPYNIISFKKLCQEFNLPENPDFRYKAGINLGLGTVHVYNDGEWEIPKRGEYLEYWPNNLGTRIFSDDPPNKNYLQGFILANQKQYEWFSPFLGKGLTKPGMGRLNRAVEAFVYCIVGAEVNTRGSIIKSGGGGQETQQEMIKLFEEAIIEEDIAKSVQRYQLVIQEAKLQLNFAVAPDIWLIPSNLIINTESIMGYNNFLQKANNSMTFGLNQAINIESKSVGLNHNIKKNKVILPHVMKKQQDYKTPAPALTQKPIQKPTRFVKVKPTLNIKKSETQSHDLNKNIIMIAAAGIGWWLFR